MKIKSFGISIALLTTLSLSFTGCGSDSSADSNSNPNSTTLTWNDTGDQFVIKTQMNNLTDYYHVAHKIIDEDNENIVLNEGNNNTGTMTTTCSKQSATGSYIEYSCSTVSDTNSPLDTYPSEKTIQLYDNKNYKVILDERSFTTSSKTTTIGSLVQP